MKPKMFIKLCVDVAMTLALLLLMAYQLIGEEAHEWIGILMFLLFVIHHSLNRSWSRNILNGTYHPRRIAQTVPVILILVCMAGSMVSGIILSRYVFAGLHIRGGAAWARTVHMVCAYWNFAFMGIHLGIHWNLMLALAKKAGIGTSRKSVLTMRVLTVLIVLYGVFAFEKRDIWNYLILKNHFAFYDFSEPVIFFLLDYLAVMGLFVILGYFVNKGLLCSKKRCNK